MDEEKYRFVAEWFDETIKLKRKFLLSFYPSDNSVDMYDLVIKKLFLRRLKCDTVQISDLFVGSVINVLSRQLVITDYGDKKTANKFSRDVESTILIINESGLKNMGEIISVLEYNNLILNKGKMIAKDRSGFNCSSFSERLEDIFLVLEVRGEGAIFTLRKLLNPESPCEKPLSSEMGDVKKYCICPMDEKIAKQEVQIFFPTSREVHCNTVRFINSTICIIKPHAVREKVVGRIIQNINEAGFKITAFEIITFNSSTSKEFLDVYKGVVPEYKDMVAQLMSGPCIGLEITGDENRKIPTEFRALVGPSDPEIARKLRPGTLRALFGHDKIKNAVHCTDLPEDSILELDYVFKILSA